jgi:molecular chaperone HtpG
MRTRRRSTLTQRPNDIETFVRTQELLSGLQIELDTCWAVLGEVYGRHSTLSNLQLSLRRVRSNLDDLSTFSKSIDFVPVKAAFGADPEIAKLLVGPLYGDNPLFGVRELVQNAVDACLERIDIERRSQFNSAQPMVLLSLDGSDGDGWTLTITDSGVGMTSETIYRYFLNAGASFRNTEQWRRLHEDNGHSRVTRSGRFGIGILAAFLLGPEIAVCSRPIEFGSPQQRAIRFAATLDTEFIELRHTDRDSGTNYYCQARRARCRWPARETKPLRYARSRFISGLSAWITRAAYSRQWR